MRLTWDGHDDQQLFVRLNDSPFSIAFNATFGVAFALLVLALIPIVVAFVVFMVVAAIQH